MKKLLFTLLLSVPMWVQAETLYNIIPEPQSIKAGKGTFVLNENTHFCANSDEAQKVAQFFSKKMGASTGYDLAVNKTKGNNTIELVITNKVKGDEAYTLDVTVKGVIAKAATAKGLFYAMQSFLQLLPPQIESEKAMTVKWEAPAVNIVDKPRFAYRGIMLDVCRHYFPISMIKHQIDVLSMYKINNIHIHLTEDQGWRMEIKKYPELTKIGAWRTDDTGKKFGGYYTQEELKDIVRYAAERHINIVPEFEIPGHELAAISAYPWLSCRNVEITSRPSWGIEDVVMCPGKETTFQFLQDIIDEMVEIFPSKYYHIGGDESPRKEWAACPLCQKRADELGLKAEEGRSREAQLQSYVVSRMEKYLNSKGKSIIGWDEILEGGNLNKSAIVMSWRGTKGGIAGAKAGHKVIMTPSRDGYYLDYYQGDELIEPYGIGRYNPLEKTYNLEPVTKEIEEAGASENILGPQGNLWTEYVQTPEKFDYRLYPRGIAIAETGWTQRDKKDFKSFARRLDSDASIRLKEHHVNFHIPLPEQPGGSVDYIAFLDKQTVTFQTTRPETMVYTLDGSEPTPQSQKYTAPLQFTDNATIKIATVLPSGFMSPVRTIHVEKQKLAPALTDNSTKQGLNLRYVPGTYVHCAELSDIPFWEKKSIQKIEDIIHQTQLNSSTRDVKTYAAIAEGRIQIPQDGIYYFRANFPAVYVDGKLVVDNDAIPEGNRHFKGGRSMALKAGQHELKIYYMCRIVDGLPSWWTSPKLLYRWGDTGDFKEVTQEMIFK